MRTWRTIGIGAVIGLAGIFPASLPRSTDGPDPLLPRAIAYVPVLAGAVVILVAALAGMRRRDRPALGLVALAGALQVVAFAIDLVTDTHGASPNWLALAYVLSWPLLGAGALFGRRGRRQEAFARRPERPRREPLDKRFGRGWREAGATWAMLREARGLLVLPLGSLALGLGVWGLLFAAFSRLAHPWIPHLFLTSLVAMYPATLTGTFTGVAFLSAMDARLHGRPASVRDGLRVAWRRRRAIAGWALLSAGVGALLQALQQLRSDWVIGPVVSWAIGAAWALVSMLAVPVLALEDVGVADAVRRGARLARDRWGEGVAGAGNLSLVWVVAFTALGLLAAPAVEAGTAGIVALALVFAAAIAVMGVQIQLLGLSLYRFAVDGETLGRFEPGDLERAVQPRR